MAWAKQNQHMTCTARGNDYGRKLDFIACHILKPHVFSLVDFHDCVQGDRRKSHNNKTLPVRQTGLLKMGRAIQNQHMAFRGGEIRGHDFRAHRKHHDLKNPHTQSISMFQNSCVFPNPTMDGGFKFIHVGHCWR